MPTALCAECGTEFTVTAARGRFCNARCYRANARTAADRTLVSRFWAKVKKDAPGACWLWQASTVRGYGQFHLPRDAGKHRTIYAHRLAWVLTNGDITDNLSVLHRCDTPLCCNPNHLFLGTQADNLADARAKGRLIDGAHLIKLSDADLDLIRRSYRRGNGRQLAAQFSVTLTTIMRAAKGDYRLRPVFQRVAHRDIAVRGDFDGSLQSLATLPQQPDRNHDIAAQTDEVSHGR